MIQAAVVCNGVGASSCYRSSEALRFEPVPVSDPGWTARLERADWIVVPNGCDHVAMWRARREVERMLERGGALICADGWFTDWVPGHRWIHDNTHRTGEVRYRIGVDRHGLLDGVDVEEFAQRRGLRGWWACGYIEAAPGADVLLEDTWGRPVLVLDERTTRGRMLLSASGPLAELYGGEGPGIGRFWSRALHHLASAHGRPAQPQGAICAARAAAAAPERYEGPLAGVHAGAAPRIGLVFNGVWSHWTFATAPKYRSLYRLLYVHELRWEDVRDLDALVVPFQSDHAALAAQGALLDRFLGLGRTIAVFGSSAPGWLGAVWESRPVDNAWWLRPGAEPPLCDTDRSHPIYARLAPRHAAWHCHGAYTSLPPGAWVIQRNAAGEAVTWQVERGGGTLFASTKDPIVEHGVQQTRHLDHYNDALTAWLCGQQPEGRLEIEPRWYGVRFAPPA